MGLLSFILSKTAISLLRFFAGKTEGAEHTGCWSMNTCADDASTAITWAAHSVYTHKHNKIWGGKFQGWLSGEKSMGTRVGMEHVQERLYVHATVHKSSHPHKYPYMWCIHYMSVLTASGILQPCTTLTSLSQTPHVGIFIWVWWLTWGGHFISGSFHTYHTKPTSVVGNTQCCLFGAHMVWWF